MLVNKKFPLKHLPCNSNLFVIIHLWFSCKPVWYAINSIYSSFVMQNYHLCFIIHSLQKTSIACTSSQVFLRTLHQGNYSVLFTHIYCVHKFLAISSLLLLSHKRKSFNVLYYFRSVWCLLLCCFCSFLAISNCHYLYGRIIRTKGSRLWESSFSHFLYWAISFAVIFIFLFCSLFWYFILCFGA